MVGRERGLDTEYLKRHCPLAWNTPKEAETYARLGYDVVGEAFRIIEEMLGAKTVPPERLPVRLDLAFSVRATEGDPVVRVAKRQEGEPEPDPGSVLCTPEADKPTLTARYLREHAVTTWDDEAERPAYTFLGYQARRALIRELIEAGGADEAEAQRTLRYTVDTTKTAGGCAVVCGPGGCSHKAQV